MVKGTSRRVIVVRSPDERLFEQAIFLLKEDITQENPITAQQLIRQASEAADSYLRQHSALGTRLGWLRRYGRQLWFLAGGLLGAAVCALALL